MVVPPVPSRPDKMAANGCSQETQAGRRSTNYTTTGRGQGRRAREERERQQKGREGKGKEGGAGWARKEGSGAAAMSPATRRIEREELFG